uniref:ATP synthase subunit b, chloroplastic n=1 Tax=Nymphaea jamesoniana TaxID=349246 RepID=A0A807BKM5_9MAGN|nr:ATP synthase CF0 B subunit [Nymphaea jamesoniana]
MKNLTDSFVFWVTGHPPGVSGLIPIFSNKSNKSNVVLGVLIFFGKGVLSDLLDNRKQRILSTIRNSEELCGGAVEQLEKARARLRKVEREAEEFRVNGYSEIEQEKMNLINAAYQNLEQLENYKNETIHFEQQRAINQVQQRVFQQALQGALGTLNNCLNGELHLRTIGANIGILGAMKEITD